MPQIIYVDQSCRAVGDIWVRIHQNIQDIRFFFIQNTTYHQKKPIHDFNISLVEGYKFSICRSMKNIWLLMECGGANKYVLKYIWKNRRKKLCNYDDKFTPEWHYFHQSCISP